MVKCNCYFLMQLCPTQYTVSSPGKKGREEKLGGGVGGGGG